MALTPQEFERLKAQLGAQAKGATPRPVTPGFGASVASDLGERGSNLNATLQSTMHPATKGLAILGQGAGFVGDVIGEGIKQIPFAEQAIKTVAAPVINSQSVQGMMKGYQEWKAAHPEAATNLESVVNIASLIPATKGAQVAGKTAATGAGSIVSGTGKVITTAGRATEGAGKGLYKTAFTPTVAEAERILSYEAKVPFLSRVRSQLTGAKSTAPLTRADTAFEKGVVGTERMVGVQAKRISDKLWTDKIVPVVRGSSDVLTKEELFAPAQKLIAETVDPTRRKALQSAFDALAEDYAGTDVWSLEAAQALKRDLAKFTPAKLYRGQDVASEVKTLQHEMAGAIRQKTYNSLSDVNIKKDYLDYANLSELEDIGVKAISEAKLKGGFGTFWSAMYDMVTTPVKTIGGRTLYRVGNVLEFTGEKGIKKFGDFLRSKGYAKP